MRTRFSSLVATLAALALPACGPQAPAATGTPADEQAIREIANQYASAYGKGDAAALAALVTEDYEDVVPTGEHRQGKAAFQASMTKELAMMPAGMSMAMTATTAYVRWIDANSAIAGGTWETTPAMPPMPAKGSWMAVVAKRDGAWKMQSALGAPDMSAMMTPPDTSKGKKP